MTFKEALEYLKEGRKIALPEWNGYWQKEEANQMGSPDRVMMHCRDGRILDINGGMDDTFMTLDYIVRDDWGVLRDDYEINPTFDEP